MLRTMNLVRVLVLVGLVAGMLGPVSVLPLSAQGPYSEDFDGFTVGATVGADAGWYDGGGGPLVNEYDGVAGSQGLSPAGNIFNWTAHPFSWSDSTLTGVVIQMDFETGTDAQFDDDRCAWTTVGTSTSSSNQFGAQLDHTDGGIVTYWKNASAVNVREPIVTFPTLSASTWYRFRVEITKLTDTSARLDVSLVQLDGSGNPTGSPLTGTVDTAALGTNAPANTYFAGSLAPSYKNYNAKVGEADNAYFEVLTSGSPTCYALTLGHTGDGSDPAASPANSTGCSDGQYVADEVIALSAVPDAGSWIEGWTNTDDDGSTASTNSLTMPASAHSVGVTYGPPPPLPIDEGDEWRYFKGDSAPSSSWNQIGFDDSAWLIGESGFGFGDGDDGTVLSDMQNSYVSVYARKEFTVADPGAVTGLELSMDYDDGFVAYLNGTEVARDNVSGTPPAYNALADANHEASGGDSSPQPVAYYAVSPSLLVVGTNVLAVQGHNYSLSSSDFSLIPTLEASAPPVENWVAYNDCVYDPTKHEAATDPNGQLVHYIAPNVTTYNIGTGSPGPSSGELLDQATGNPTGVTATLSESGGVFWQPDISSSWTGGYDTALGTDARNTFGGIADMTGVIYYGPSAGWYVDLTFTGLDPAKEYTFATSASRANSAYTNRVSIYTISGVDAAANSSTAGTVEYLGNPLSVSFNTGDNHIQGYVARWTGIEPGADGSFAVRATHHPTAESGYKAYAFDVFMLAEEEAGVPTCYELTLGHTGEGSDPVASLANSAGCPTGEYVEGAVIGLIGAVPDAGWWIDGWTGTDDDSSTASTNALTMPAGAHSVDVNYTETAEPPAACEDFESGWSDGTRIDDINQPSGPQWYANNGPYVENDYGVGGTWGLASSGNIFTWVAHPFSWNASDLLGVNFQMDFKTDGAGGFDDDRVGWMIADDDVNSDYIFGVQMDPASGFRIEGYWDHDIGVDKDKRPPIVSLPALSANAWYQLRAEFTRLSATSAKIYVELWSLDGSGNPDSLVESGSIADTSELGDDSPDPGYFTGPIWPAYKNHTSAAAPADNACFEIVTPADNTAPDQPTLISPSDGAVGVSLPPELRVNVTDPDGGLLDVTFYGRELTGDDFTIIPLPDTQKYVASSDPTISAIFEEQTEWIVDNVDDLNIVYVGHEGDIVDTASSTTQWDIADDAMSLLENPVTTGLAEGVPYSVVPGNHDQPTTNYNSYFGVSRFTGRGYYGGYYGSDNDNNYTLFSAEGMDFIAISLDYAPTPDTAILDWADGLLKTYGARRGIVVSHYLLGTGNPGSFSPQGQDIYDALKDNPNLFLMLCGHVHGEGRRQDTYSSSTVYTLLADYQDYSNGGNGYLRIMEFSPATDEIHVKTYSPFLDQWETDANSEFTLAYDMEGGGSFVELGTVNDVSSGSDAFITWPGLSQGTEYEWFVEVSDPISTTTSAEWTFTTELPVIDPPDAPTDLGATAFSYSRIDLEWTDNSDNEEDFEIEVSTAGVGGPFSPLDTVAANTEEYSDAELDPETEYCYRVRATNTAGPSSYTNVDCATTPEQPPPICEDFNAFTVGLRVGTHFDWFDGDGGPYVRASNGVAGSQGLEAAGSIFTWVGQPFDWTDPDFLGVNLQMDFRTDGSAHFDDDRVGWMIADDDDNSDYIFGVQMDPGGTGATGYNIEAYWDGDTFGDDGGRTSIAELPDLSPNAWYRLRAEITKLPDATSASIDVTLRELDSGGNPGQVVAEGSIADTDLLPDTAGEEIPNPAYFAGPIWPAYKNFTTAAAPADNACYEIVTAGAPTCYALTLGHTGQGSDPVASPAKSAECDNAGDYVAGESIALSGAVPVAGWEIDSWTGTANDSSTASTNSLTMPAGAHSADVNYTEIVPTCYALTLGHTGQGADPVASPTNSTGCPTGEYFEGEEIDLSGAAPDSGWQISGWTNTDDDGSTESTNSLTMPAGALEATVTYTEIGLTCYTLTLGHSGQGTDPVASPTNSTGCPAGEYLEDEEIDLSGAVPDTGWQIHSWTGTDDDASTADTNSLTMPPVDEHLAAVNYTEIEPQACTDFDSGYILDQELRIHADWFYEQEHSGPRPTSGAGVAGSIGLSNGESIFTWVARPFYWNAPEFLGASLQMDFQADASGHLEDDRIGWMISDTDDDSSNFFGVRLGPGGAGYNIAGIWDGVGLDGRTPPIKDLPALSADTWYRVWVIVTKLTATSSKVQAVVAELDASGIPWKYIASGSIEDTSTLGADAPHSKYFTDPIWPAFKNSTSLSGAADLACLFVTRTGSVTIVKESDPTGGTGFSFDGGSLGTFSLDDGGSSTFDNLSPGNYGVIEIDPIGWDLDSVVCTGGDTDPIYQDPIINCWEDSHQDPVLSTVSDPLMLVPDDNEWTEYQESGASVAGIFASPAEDPPLMRFYGIVPNGLYQVSAGLFRDSDYRYYYGYDPATPRALYVDVETGPQGYFSEFDLGTYEVTNTVFSLYTDHADLLWDWGASEYYAWSWIRLVSTPAITEGVTIHLDSGEDVTCTFINEERPAELGSITIVKETDPAGGTGFSFNAGLLGNFSIDDGGSTSFDNLLPGDYPVTEVAPTAWYLDNVVCTGGDSDPVTGGRTIHLESGEDVICTFTNESYVTYLPLAISSP